MRMSRVPRWVRLPFAAVLMIIYGLATTARATYNFSVDFMKGDHSKDISEYIIDASQGK